MDCLESMNRALDYIENNLQKKIDYDKIAQAACCSVYHFQRMFSFITNIPLSEYIRRRKMTLAAFELQNSETKVIDLALKYGYDSPESFSRAFQYLHGITPTSARKCGANIKAYPRISFQITIKGDSEMNYKIMEKPAFQVYGIEEIFDTKDGENLKAIPEFWCELRKDGRFDQLIRSSGYPSTLNAVCGYRDIEGTTFPYMICCLKTPLSDTSGYKIVDIPSATWAIFVNEPHIIEETPKATQELTSRVYTDWLPTSNYTIIEGFEFEMYYETANGKCYEETWIRVAPKNNL
ncbi:MAG: helix-turn-helix domain-containing protein [Thermotaleaceae bacterium]